MKQMLCLLLMLSAASVWAQPIPPPGTRIEAKRGVEPDTTTFPPKPRGYVQALDPNQALRITAREHLTGQRIAALRQRAEVDQRVRSAVGARFAFLSAALFEGAVKLPVLASRNVKLTYFNYVTNRAVVVRFSADQVKTVEVRPADYQPPESDGETAAAAEIVRSDSRYAGAVRDLPARGILTPAPAGHRYIYVIFKRPDEPAAFIAVVDLTDRKVVRAEPVTHQ